MVSQLVLVLMLMLDACAYFFSDYNCIIIVDSTKNKSSGTQCVVTLFKAKVISSVKVEYQFSGFQNTVCNVV